MTPPRWQRDRTSVEPPSYALSAYSDEVLEFDTTALLIDDSAPTEVECHLHRLGQTTPVTLVDSPTTDDVKVYQRIRGLTAGTNYELHVTFMTSGNRRDMKLIIECVR